MTAHEFVDAANSGSLPWETRNIFGKNKPWTDSAKEQYFHLLNAETANAMELERWRLNNEYNTPRAQMERLIDAGINPAAAYQQVSSGNSQSAPDTHQPGTAAFHDTSDKLSKINTIMNGISNIMSTIFGGVGAAKGIQDVQFGYQNNWYDKMRADYARGPGLSTMWLGDQSSLSHMDRPIEVAPGLYMDGTAAQLFPELRQGLGFASVDYKTRQSGVSIQKQLADRRTRIDNLIQDIFRGLETNASTSEMMRLFLELFAYGAMSKFGGF